MSRLKRVHLPHGTYLVVERFARGTEVLVAAAAREHTEAALAQIALNRARYEEQLGYAAWRWRSRVHAYCWLPDSALLMIQIGYAPLDRMMHDLRSPFSRYLRDHAVAAAYASRYRAILIDPEEFFLALPRYIFQRPVVDGLCEDALDYPYSSVAAVLGATPPPFLEGSEVANELVDLGFNSRPAMARYMAARPPPGFNSLAVRGSRMDARIAGRAYFLKKVWNAEQRPAPAVPPGHAIDWVALRLGIKASDILGRSKLPEILKARALIAWLVSCSGCERVSAVANWLPSGRSALERAVQQWSRRDPGLFSDAMLAEFADFVRELAREKRRDDRTPRPK